MGSSVLITGYKGIVGSIIWSRLAAMNFRLSGYDLRDGQDILSTDLLANNLKGKDACIHLAGIPGPSSDPWIEFKQTNVNGTLSVIEACRMVGVKKLIYMSSGAVYGLSTGATNPVMFPISEDNPMPPFSKLCLYDQSKILCEQHLEEAAKKYDMTCIALRLETPHPPAPIIEQHFYISISHANLAEAYRAALESDFTGYGAFNIADPEIHPSVTVNIQEWIRKKYPDIPNMTSGRESLLDISKIKKVLGYKPV